VARQVRAFLGEKRHQMFKLNVGVGNGALAKDWAEALRAETLKR